MKNRSIGKKLYTHLFLLIVSVYWCAQIGAQSEPVTSGMVIAPEIVRDPATNAETTVSWGLLWKPGQTIKIKFLNGDEMQQKEVKKYSVIWTNYANLHFSFITEGYSDIRIAFNWHDDNGSHSFIGTSARNISQSEPTINFGWINRGTSEEEIEGLVLHEFGHALGCEHELKSPSSRIKWNRDVVYEHYRQIGWDKTKVDASILNKSKSGIYTDFDPLSVMMYSVSATENVDQVCYPENYVLSAKDKQMISLIYPLSNTSFTIVNNYIGRTSLWVDGQRYDLDPNDKIFPHLEETSGKVELYSCGWPDSYTSSGQAQGCCFIPYTVSSGQYWEIVQTLQAPQIIMNRKK